MKKFIAALLALTMVLSIAACGSSTSTPSAPAASTPSVSEVHSGEEMPSEPEVVVNNEVVEYYMSKANEVVVNEDSVTLTDDSGREPITIKKNPEKVAVLYGSLACLWYEAGGTVQYAIGGKNAVDLYVEQIGHDFTKDEGVSVVAEVSSGANWDIEAILAEEPDLIVCATSMKGYATISGPAEAVGIPVIGINYASVQDYLKYFKVFCNLNDKPELWDEIADNTAKKIIEVVSNVPENVESPKAIILALPSDTVKFYTGGAQSGTILKELGATNMADPNNDASSSSLEVNMEDLYVMNPEMIFFVERDRTGESRQLLMDEVGDDPIWNELSAVKEGKIYYLDMGLFLNKANHRYDEAYVEMAKYLYPDVNF